MSGFSIFSFFYSGLVRLSENFQSLILLIFRLVLGYGFLQSGLGKFADLGSTASFFHTLAIPYPEANAIIVAIIETFGGICLILGLGTRLWALLLAFIMIVAFLTADFEAVKNIFVDPLNVTRKVPFNFLLVSLLLFAFGPGKISLDYLLEKMRP